MSDDFGTVSSKRGSDRGREIELLRRHYHKHRETLANLSSDSPSEHLAGEYQRLISEIEMAVRKLDELEGRAPAAAAAAGAAASGTDTNPAFRPKTQPGKTAPGNRPLSRTEEQPAAYASQPASSQSRLALILIAGALVLGVIGYLIWHASSRNKTTPATIVEQPVSVTNASTAPPTVTPVPIAPPPTLKITPALADYGTIRKGTRAVRQFEVSNPSNSPVEIVVARSACRCLYYDYKSKLAANGKETITVTVDGARAKAGELTEQVEVSAKSDPSVGGTFTVQATIK